MPLRGAAAGASAVVLPAGEVRLVHAHNFPGAAELVAGIVFVGEPRKHEAADRVEDLTHDLGAGIHSAPPLLSQARR